MNRMTNQRETGDLQERLAGAISYAKATEGVAWPDVAAGYVLQMLGLDDLDAAAIRSIDAWAHDYANDAWRELSAEGQLAVARAVLEAACTATEEREPNEWQALIDMADGSTVAHNPDAPKGQATQPTGNPESFSSGEAKQREGSSKGQRG